MAYIALDHVEKLYHVGEVTITAVSDISFTVDKGEFVVVVGPSGAGKTTVLNILGGMDSCTSGTITVDGQTISSYGPKELTVYRRFDIGFVFQFYNLVQNLTALENVELATQIAKSPLPPEEVLAHVGLSHRLHNFPAQLSGGEQQRVAIARALANAPKLLLADEPTGNLDPKTSDVVFAELLNIVKETGLSALIATHNMELASAMDRKVRLEDGRLVNTGISGLISGENFY